MHIKNIKTFVFNVFIVVQWPKWTRMIARRVFRDPGSKQNYAQMVRFGHRETIIIILVFFLDSLRKQSRNFNYLDNILKK